MTCTKEAALQGIKDNGHAWKYTISGVRQHTAEINRLVAESDPDAEKIQAEVRAVAARFDAFLKAHEANTEMQLPSSMEEDLEWLRDDDLVWHISEFGLPSFKDEYVFRMNSLYDWADYWRIVIK